MTLRAALQTALGAAAAPLLVAGFGYMERSMIQVALGLPPVPSSFGSFFRTGAAALVATLLALPATLTDLLSWRGGWFRVGLPAFSLYLILLVLSLPRRPVQRWMTGRLGDSGPAVLSSILGLVIVLASARLLVFAQGALRIQGLLTGEDCLSGAACWLTAVVQAGDEVHLTRRYVGLLLLLAGAGHLTAVHLRRARSFAPGSSQGRVSLLAGHLAAATLTMAAICVPAQYALVRIAAGFPLVRVLPAGSGNEASGFLLDQAPGWVTVYEPGTGRLRLLAVELIREIEPGPVEPLFPLRLSGAPERPGA